MPLDLYNFDIKSFLDEHEIDWRLPGHKNVGDACVLAVCCPFCYTTDKSFHCGILKEPYGVFSCLRCGASGNLFVLLSELTNINYPTFIRLVKYSNRNTTIKTSDRLREKFFSKQKEDIKKYEKHIALPPRAIDERLFNSFLKHRNFDLDTIKKYKAYPCLSGKYKGRIILPVYDNLGKRVSFQARRMSKGKAGLPYLNPKFAFGEHLYWLHEHKKNWALLVEGIFDRWRFGSGSVATFRNNITQSQLLLLLQKNIRTIYIGWESDFLEHNIKVAENIAPIFSSVKVLILPEKQDPDTLGRENMLELMSSAEKI